MPVKMVDFRSNFLKLCVEHFFPFGGAGLPSIFRFLLNSEALGAHNLCYLLVTLLQEVERLLAISSCSTCIMQLKIASFGNFTLKFFFREISPSFQRNSRIMCMSLVAIGPVLNSKLFRPFMCLNHEGNKLTMVMATKSL